jgi:hypothetical protein
VRGAVAPTCEGGSQESSKWMDLVLRTWDQPGDGEPWTKGEVRALALRLVKIS